MIPFPAFCRRAILTVIVALMTCASDSAFGLQANSTDAQPSPTTPTHSVAQDAPSQGSSSPSAAIPASGSSAEKSATDTSEKKVAEPEVPLDQKPYEVKVEIGFGGNDTNDPHLRKWLTEEVRKGILRMFGSMWNADVEDSSWLIPADSNRLQRLTEPELLNRYASTSAEKVILLAISGSNGIVDISCREYDVRVQELSPVLTEQTGDVQNVGAIASRLARDCFRPLLLLSGPSIDKAELEFLLQAGSITPPDPTAAQITDGDVLRTFVRVMDRRIPGRVKLLQRIDLCYVRVTTFNQELPSTLEGTDDSDITVEGKSAEPSGTTFDQGHVKGVLISHGLVPFGGRSRNMQQIALRQRPSASKSRVRLVLQSQPDRPLICFRVDKVTKLRHTDANEAAPVRLLSDRNGVIQLQADPDNPTFWLYVYSGSALLARVPYAPGLIPLDTMKLPDDSVRLGVEGELYLLRDQLVDMVAQKAVYMSIAKKAAEAGDVAGVEAAIATLDKLPGQKVFEDLLNRTRIDAVTRADQQKNAGAKRKVESLCKKMGESLTAFFSAEKRLQDAELLQQLRDDADSRTGVDATTSAPPANP